MERGPKGRYEFMPVLRTSPDFVTVTPTWRSGLLHLGASRLEVKASGFPEEENFLGRCVEFRSAVRLYGEGRATGPPKDL